MPYWMVTVTNGPATKGDVLAVEAPTEADARRIALELTPGNLDEVTEVEQITAAEYKAATTPPTIPPAQD